MVDLEVSVITDEFSLEFDEVCEHLQSKDVKYIELRQVWIGNICEVDQQTLDDAKDIINDCGLKVSAIAGPLLKVIPPSINPEPTEKANYSTNWQYNYSKSDHIIDVAEFFNAKYIRVFGYQGQRSEKYPWEVLPVDKWDDWQVYKDWSDIVSQLKSKVNDKNKLLVCENDSGFNLSMEHIERIGRDHCGPGFGMLFDSGNVGIHYEDGFLNEKWRSRIGKYIQYIHAKGVSMDSNGDKHADIVNANGDMCNWPEIIQYLKDSPKESFINPTPEPLFLSIETHMGKENKWENSDASLTNLMKLVY